MDAIREAGLKVVSTVGVKCDSKSCDWHSRYDIAELLATDDEVLCPRCRAVVYTKLDKRLLEIFTDIGGLITLGVLSPNKEDRKKLAEQVNTLFKKTDTVVLNKVR